MEHCHVVCGWDVPHPFQHVHFHVLHRVHRYVLHLVGASRVEQKTYPLS